VPPAGIRAKLLNKIGKLNDQKSGHSSQSSGLTPFEDIDDEPELWAHSTPEGKNPNLDAISNGEASHTRDKRYKGDHTYELSNYYYLEFVIL